VPLQGRTKAEFEALFRNAEVGHIRRSENLGDAYIDIGGGPKLGREFSVVYIYSEDSETSACDKQWRETESGRCHVPLTGNWRLCYAWSPL